MRKEEEEGGRKEEEEGGGQKKESRETSRGRGLLFPVVFFLPSVFFSGEQAPPL
jgi:hypothetical protein